MNTRQHPVSFYLNQFSGAVNHITLPEKFTFPFNYKPDQLSKMACEELHQKMENYQWPHNFGLDENQEGAMGKMFGILVVLDSSGQCFYLAAFSGKIGDSCHFENFVPPVYDRLAHDEFFTKEEEKITAINQKIESLSSSEQLKSLLKQLQDLTSKSETELQFLKTKIKEGKKQRAQKREEMRVSLDNTSYEELLQQLIKESQDSQFHYKRKARAYKAQIEALKTQIRAFEEEITTLKQKRKQCSADLQKRLFQQYKVSNAMGKYVPITDLFKELPPAGTGDCAAPKLLQYAYNNQLTPIALAEFWWGISPPREVRHHKAFYPACKSKCEPLLSFMLQGLRVSPNPILEKQLTQQTPEIVFEDHDIIVVNKPAGILSVPGKELNHSVESWLHARIKNYEGPILIHRLDMSTSGLLIGAKNKQSHYLLQQQLMNHEIHKRYCAVLDGTLTFDEGLIDLPLRVDYHNRPNQVVCFELGKDAQTKWQVIKRKEGKTWVRMYPITGRTHQLRVHAAHHKGLGTPIVGDDLYGSPADRLYLHAEYISFRHPVSNSSINFEVKPNFHI